MTGFGSNLLKLLKGSPPLDEGVRVAIIYVALLIAAYEVGLRNANLGRLLAFSLLFGSFLEMLRISEPSLRFLQRRLPTALATIIVAYLLGQALYYLFSFTFFMIFFLVYLGLYLERWWPGTTH